MSEKPVVAAIAGHLPRRRPRAFAGGALSRRECGRQTGLARSEARTAAGRRRHTAAAAARRRRDRDQHDRERRASAGEAAREDRPPRPRGRRRSGGCGDGIRRFEGIRYEAAAPRRATSRSTNRISRRFASSRAMASRRSFRICPRRCAASTPSKPPASRSSEGLAIERRCFVELMQTPESQSLRHAFFAERAASKIDGVPESTPVRKIDKAAVIGAGTMGGGISICFLNAGIPVWLRRNEQGGTRQGHRAHRRHLRRTGQEGQARASRARPPLGAHHADARLRRRSPGRHRHRGGVRIDGSQAAGVHRRSIA